MADLFDMNDCREWLRQNGHTVGERGRISEKLQALYFMAGAPKPERATVSPPEFQNKDYEELRKRSTVNFGGSPVPAQPETLHVEGYRSRGRKVLQPHHYDPRPFLFSGDSLLAQRFWKIDPTRKLWSIEEIEELGEMFGDAPLSPTVRIGGVEDGEAEEDDA